MRVCLISGDSTPPSVATTLDRKQMANTSGAISEVRRLRWVHFGLAFMMIFLAFIHTCDNRMPNPNAWVLVAYMVGGAIFAAKVSRDIWSLESIRDPLWKVVARYVVAAFILGTYIALNELHLWHWSKLYIDLPFIVYFGITLSVTWMTERKRHVRVYFGTRELVFRSSNNCTTNEAS